MCAVTVTAIFWWVGRLHRPPVTRSLYARWVWVSVWMVVGGLWFAGVWPAYRMAMVHVMFLGGFSLMTFAVGTMVV